MPVVRSERRHNDDDDLRRRKHLHGFGRCSRTERVVFEDLGGEHDQPPGHWWHVPAWPGLSNALRLDRAGRIEAGRRDRFEGYHPNIGSDDLTNSLQARGGADDGVTPTRTEGAERGTCSAGPTERLSVDEDRTGLPCGAAWLG